jgi:hypothetical protein
VTSVSFKPPLSGDTTLYSVQLQERRNLCSTIMVHYIRFLKTAQVKHCTSKSVCVKALITITTDLGDTFMFSDAKLISCLVAADNTQRVLCRDEVHWLGGSRELLFDVTAYIEQKPHSLRLHIFHDKADHCLPSVLGAWSAPFEPVQNSHAASLIERQISLPGLPMLKIWEETGNSIARHIW